MINCPSCWNKIEVLPWAVQVVCPYCNTIILIEREKIEAIWKQSPIVPFPTMFSVWKYFYAVEDKNSNDVLRGINVKWFSEEDFYKEKLSSYLVKIYISWHIRCMNDSGFWDKWLGFVVDDKKSFFKDKNIMIQEDEWLITAFNVIDADFVRWNFEKFYQNVWDVIDWYFVVESWICNVEGLEWQFNYPFLWEKIQYVDLKKGNDYYLVEKIDSNILVFKKI